MQEILKGVIKIYQPKAIEDTDEIKNIIFTGGEGVNGSSGHNFTLSPFTTNSLGRVSSNYWVAVNKKILAENYFLLKTLIGQPKFSFWLVLVIKILLFNVYWKHLLTHFRSR